MIDCVVVTGAAGDVGRALVALFLERGKAVVGWDIDPARLAENDALFPDRYASVGVDICDADAVRDAYAQTCNPGRHVDVLINNAGAVTAPRLAETGEREWTRDIEINLNGAFRCLKAVQPAMAARGGGTVINVASVNGVAMYGYPGYSAAKAGLIGLTKFAATEYGPAGIRVNAIMPGTVRTKAWDERLAANPAILDNVKKYYSLRDVCSPVDIAELAWFLAYGPSRMITGAVIPIDGGLTAGIGRVAGEFCGVEF
ncbi:SDR family oxidoreductase [Devosia sp. YIM 151766]|uniref:SDR family oxidoreductase n=1 Tax=Devosia sp. YIM 151766 TaxID=3017325 RepID=UPI00255CC998|nr:SDR family oxidoreductase [Devosia sp. YIM 151766]WIY53250.1 SDR family oxidoreductase [Devosia sp. YIM 151766]